MTSLGTSLIHQYLLNEYDSRRNITPVACSVVVEVVVATGVVLVVVLVVVDVVVSVVVTTSCRGSDPLNM